MNWEKLFGVLPVIVQDIDTSEVLLVFAFRQESFENLIGAWQNGSPIRGGGNDRPIPLELYVDCDADCLLVKARANDAQREECRRSFFSLEEQAPSNLFSQCSILVTVAQCLSQKDVLMVAFADKEAVERTLSTRNVHYLSRSRGLWMKGEESGNVQRLSGGRFYSPSNALVLDVVQVGSAACHDGYRSCFYRRIEKDGSLTVVGERIFDPSKVYKK